MVAAAGGSGDHVFEREPGPVMWLGFQCIVGMAAGMALVITPQTFAEGASMSLLIVLRIGGVVLAAMTVYAFAVGVLRPGQVLRIDHGGLSNGQHRGFKFRWHDVRAMGEGFDGSRLSCLRFIVEQPDGTAGVHSLTFKDWDASPEEIVVAVRHHLGPGLSDLKDVTPTPDAHGSSA